MLPTLHQLSGEYLEAAKKLSEMDLSDNVVEDTLSGLSGDLEVKATNVALFVQHLEATAEAIKAAEERMEKRRKAIENRAGSVKAYLKYHMEKTGISKISSPELEISIRKNPAHVVIDSNNLIPEKYWVTPPPPPPQLNKRQIASDIKDGSEIPGVHLETDTRLEIK